MKKVLEIVQYISLAEVAVCNYIICIILYCLTMVLWRTKQEKYCIHLLFHRSHCLTSIICSTNFSYFRSIRLVIYFTNIFLSLLWTLSSHHLFSMSDFSSNLSFENFIFTHSKSTLISSFLTSYQISVQRVINLYVGTYESVISINIYIFTELY